MPNTQSAKKALRQSLRRKMRNTARVQAYKKTGKSLLRHIGVKQSQEAAATLSLFYKQLDKAAKTHALSRNKARRLKSRFAKRLSASRTPL